MSLHEVQLDNVHIVVGARIVAAIGECTPEVAPQLVGFGEQRCHNLSVNKT